MIDKMIGLSGITEQRSGWNIQQKRGARWVPFATIKLRLGLADISDRAMREEFRSPERFGVAFHDAKHIHPLRRLGDSTSGGRLRVEPNHLTTCGADELIQKLERLAEHFEDSCFTITEGNEVFTVHISGAELRVDIDPTFEGSQAWLLD